MCRVGRVVVKVYDVFGRGHDEAAWAMQGTSPGDRATVNVGTVHGRSRAIGIGASPAEARGRGGAVIVFRGRGRTAARAEARRGLRCLKKRR